MDSGNDGLVLLLLRYVEKVKEKSCASRDHRERERELSVPEPSDLAALHRL